MARAHERSTTHLWGAGQQTLGDNFDNFDNVENFERRRLTEVLPLSSWATWAGPPGRATTMSDFDSQIPYWDAAASTKTFTHPLHLPWLDGIDRHAAILDYGCGYGRTLHDLEQQGFDNLAGVDTSSAMIGRARLLHPTARFTVLGAPPHLPYPDAAFDAAVLFAVLTCIPGEEAQHRLIGELNRVLKPGGTLYVSDYPLQEDERNRTRYDRCADRYDHYGVFETDDGGVFRHHPRSWFSSLLSGFEALDTRDITVNTMSGHPSKGIQLLVRKEPSSR
ncbi:class I SAM-dependent methyltransferase [Streptomyces sp. NPDC058695]|uniref:class I SAM-dependent methyltransferase n=1 Tax=Streptomyces sp. NPDC058695 TaxID=3346604 RepID=UPI0036529671